MRLHKLVVAMSALAGGIASIDSHALGLGEVKLHTALNQPLVAEIELMQVEDLTRTEILSNLASKSDFARAGVDRPSVLHGLQFKTEVSPNGRGYIKITSKDPIQEPYLNFLVEVHWPNGRILKEYTLLLDPPVYGSRTSSPVNRPEILSDRVPAAGFRPTTRLEYQPPSMSSRPDRNQRPETYRLTPDRSRQSGRISSSDYRVNDNDNLWGIAEQVRPDQDVTVQQTMLAIQRNNPGSFINSNINLLKNGEILRIPDRRDMTSLTVNEAISGVARQNREWQQWRSQVAQLDGTPGRVLSSPEPLSALDGKLAIVSAEGAADSGQDLGSSADQINGALQTELAMTREQLDKLSRENAELKSRLQDLDDQIVTLKRLVEMKDDQMSALQSSLRKSQEREEPTESATSSPPISVPDNPLFLLLGLIPFVGVGWLLVQRRLKKRKEDEQAREKKFQQQSMADIMEDNASPKPVASPSAEAAATFDQALAPVVDEFEAEVKETAQQTEDPIGDADTDAIARAAALQDNFDNDVAGSIEDEIPDLDLDELEVADTDFSAPAAPTSETASNPDPLDVDLDKLDLDFGSDDALGRDSQAAFSDQGMSSLEASLDEDFDFLSEGDEAATKLDLARAYIDMGDRDGASAILQEVLEQGNDAQKQEAKMLLAGGST